VGCLVAVIIVVLNSAAVLECGQRLVFQRAVALATILSSLPSATPDSTMTHADRFQVLCKAADGRWVFMGMSYMLPLWLY
jgi:hypothetical protein